MSKARLVITAVTVENRSVAEVVDQITATANKLLALSQDVQNKVIAALTSNA
jgi:hypothetical protein